MSQMEEPKPWGFWATFGLSLVGSLAREVVAIPIYIGFILRAREKTGDFDLGKYLLSLVMNGDFVGLGALASAPVAIGFLLLFVKLRKGWTVREYLALKIVPLKSYLPWLALVVIFVVCSDALTNWLGRPISPEFMTGIYKSSSFLPLLWFAFLVLAPVVEETTCRGFLFRGIQQSKLGPIGAVVLTAAAWSLLHLQYDPYGIASIFLGGLVLGWARWKTGSLYPCIAMHAVSNLIAMTEAHIFTR